MGDLTKECPKSIKEVYQTMQPVHYIFPMRLKYEK